MKKIEIEGTTKTIMYEAIDGTRFNNEAECVKYDNTALAVIKSRLKFIKKTDLCEVAYGYEDYTVEVISGSKDNIMMYISLGKWNYDKRKEAAIKEFENFDEKNDVCVIIFDCDDFMFSALPKTKFLEQISKALEPNNE